MLDNFLKSADNALNAEYGFNNIRPKGLIYSEYRVLKCLETRETLKSVSQRRKISQQATGKAIRGLVLKGFATNDQYPVGEKDIDRRESSISVTKQGLLARDAADRSMNNIIKDVLDNKSINYP